MSVYIENEYTETSGAAYEDIIRKVIDASLEHEKCGYETLINVLLVSDNEIKEINREYRGIDTATDVLSFPAVDFPSGGDIKYLDTLPAEEYFDPDTGELILGDIIISVDRAMAQAKLYGHSPDREIGFLTAHSMLHLFGYDHMEDDERIIMEEKQEEILSGLGLYR